MGLYIADLPFSPTRLKLYNWHKWAGVCVLALLHVAAAPKHHWLDRDGLLLRMWPGGIAPPPKR